MMEVMVTTGAIRHKKLPSNRYRQQTNSGLESNCDLSFSPNHYHTCVYWKRPPGQPWMTWMKTVQNDLDSHGLSWTDVVDLAQNRPL